jgi:NADPH:quinone reductase
LPRSNSRAFGDLEFRRLLFDVAPEAIGDRAGGVHFSFFGSFMFGAPEFPTAEIPLQAIVERVEGGAYRAEPARVFGFDEIREAHRLMEAGAANGKIVVRV